MDGHFTALLGGADADPLAAVSILARTRMRFAEPRRLRVAQRGSAALRVGGAVRVASMARRAWRSSLRPASHFSASDARDRIGRASWRRSGAAPAAGRLARRLFVPARRASQGGRSAA